MASRPVQPVAPVRPVASIVAVAATVGLALVVVAGALLGVFPRSGASGSPSAAPATATPTPSGPVVVRWFVSYSSGSAMEPGFKPFVRKYNAAQNQIFINLEIVPNANAYDILKSEIAAGNAPDIVGPIGYRSRNGFGGAFLDLAPLVKKYGYDTSRFPPELMSYMAQGGDGLVGLPYLIYPAYMFYNKDLFAAAGLPDLPKHVGDWYMGKPWDWTTVREIGLKLTLDSKGRHPTDPGFDPENIVQFGIDFQWWDGRRMASSFGGGSFVAADGRTAQIPPQWADAWRWYYIAMWKLHFAPTGKYISSTLLNQGTTVSSGKIAMDAANAWSINSYGYIAYGGVRKTAFKAWDIAVMPSWNGQTSGPLDADTFVIPKGTAHPDEAFEAMLAIMADKNLQIVFGGLPAAPSNQQAWFDAFAESLADVFPGNQVSWSVMQEMAKYPAIPSHEADMPNAAQAIKDYGDFYTRLQSTPDLNVDAELAKLQAQLQADFDAPPASPRAAG